MLKNRISLRLATAAGTAALTVAGATFGFSAFAADTGAAPEQAASAAVLPNEADAEPFFPDSGEGIPAGRLEQAGSQRDQALGQALATASGTLEEEKEEPEPEPESIPTGDPRGIAQAMLADYGWSADQFSCLDSLWQRESNWNHLAQNPSSGAYGIPQALPGSKMASAGADWQTNPATQIKWGLGYIQDRYGSPCAAWEHSQSVGWY
ncbi:MAG TPA: lytic transglycosylase domain-containing protein [Thermobifida alba]|nr:lytic transglycosylase domain-containing protein [Thermobifida alba]